MTRVLVAEDDADIRELIKLTLEFHGFEVVGARDGQEAVDFALGEPFDLIILDVRMPRMTGYEACRQLRIADATRELPIIMLSAKGQGTEIQAGLEAGATEYVLKPFAPDVLVDRLRKVLNSHG